MREGTLKRSGPFLLPSQFAGEVFPFPIPKVNKAAVFLHLSLSTGERTCSLLTASPSTSSPSLESGGGPS